VLGAEILPQAFVRGEGRLVAGGLGGAGAAVVAVVATPRNASGLHRFEA
jgi:hypothetical protein